MSKEDCIEVTGTVVEKFPSGLFSVQLEQERTVLAHLAGKLRRNRIRVLAGDRVTLELSPYDLTKGRITYRHKKVSNPNPAARLAFWAGPSEASAPQNRDREESPRLPGPPVPIRPRRQPLGA